jgi:hypothetical protein
MLPQKLDAAALVMRLAGGCVNTLAAQDRMQEAVDSLTERTDLFFTDLATQSDQKSAFDQLLANGPLADPVRNADVQKLVEQHNKLAEKYGPSASSPELVSVKKAGESLVTLKYLYKAEKFPIVWYFTYYRPRKLNQPDEGWFVVSLRFDTRLELLDLAE